ncbi:MAG: hypothetical protein PHW60_03570 [Kiritimatiellae bacterium]|nr:hypothetical protein [Kiritimatiellia bacterium]
MGIDKRDIEACNLCVRLSLESVQISEDDAAGCFTMLVRLEKIFGLMAQLLKVGVGRQLTGHETPLSSPFGEFTRRLLSRAERRFSIINFLKVDSVLSATVEASFKHLLHNTKEQKDVNRNGGKNWWWWGICFKMIVLKMILAFNAILS